jgi:DNA-binding PadR family transcriptional regulator
LYEKTNAGRNRKTVSITQKNQEVLKTKLLQLVDEANDIAAKLHELSKVV